MPDTNTNCFTPDIQWSPTWTRGIQGPLQGNVVKYNNKCYMVGASNVYLPIGIKAEGSGLRDGGIIKGQLAEAITATQEAIEAVDHLIGRGYYYLGPRADQRPGTLALWQRMWQGRTRNQPHDPMPRSWANFSLEREDMLADFRSGEDANYGRISGGVFVPLDEVARLSDLPLWDGGRTRYTNTAESREGAYNIHRAAIRTKQYTRAILPLIQGAQLTITEWVDTVNDKGNLLIEPYLYNSLHALQAAAAAAAVAESKVAASRAAVDALYSSNTGWGIRVRTADVETAVNNALTIINETLALFDNLVQPILSIDTVFENNINTAIFDAREGAAASLTSTEIARENAVSILAQYPGPTIELDDGFVNVQNLNTNIINVADDALIKASWAKEQVSAAYTSIQAWLTQTNVTLKTAALQEAIQNVQAAFTAASQATTAAVNASNTIAIVNPEVLALTLYQTYKQATEACLLNAQEAEEVIKNAAATLIWATPEGQICNGVIAWDPSSDSLIPAEEADVGDEAESNESSIAESVDDEAGSPGSSSEMNAAAMVANAVTGAEWVKQNLSITPDNNEVNACLGWIEVQCCIVTSDLSPSAPVIEGSGGPVQGLTPAATLPLTQGNTIEQEEPTTDDEDDAVIEIPEEEPSGSSGIIVPPVICPPDTEENCDTLQY